MYTPRTAGSAFARQGKIKTTVGYNERMLQLVKKMGFEEAPASNHEGDTNEIFLSLT
jgi:hypothetical protein